MFSKRSIKAKILFLLEQGIIIWLCLSRIALSTLALRRSSVTNCILMLLRRYCCLSLRYAFVKR